MILLVRLTLLPEFSAIEPEREGWVSQLAALGYLSNVALPKKQPSLLPISEAIADAELVARAVRGDRWSQDVLYRRHSHRLLAITTRLLSNRDEGEEVVQDTFVIGFDQLAALRQPQVVGSWLTQIAVSLVRRRLRRRRLIRLLGLDRGFDDAALAALATPGLRPDDCAELARLDGVLGGMPADLRIAWMLRRVEGLGLGEVASACSCSLATAKRRISAADAEVATYLSFQGGES